MVGNFFNCFRPLIATRRRRVLSGAAAVSIVVTYLGHEWVTREFEDRIARGLARRGLVVDHQGGNWNPWRGLRLEQVKVRHSASGLPVIESSNVMIHVPLGHLLRGEAKAMHWQLRDAAVTLHDAAGRIDLEAVSVAIESTPGEIQVRSAMASKAGLSVSLHGTIRASMAPETNGKASFDWQPVRTTLAALDVTTDGDPFRVTGDFTVDATSANIPWSARLQGTGRDLLWHGTPFRSVTADAVLSSGASELRAGMVMRHGSVSLSVTREGWSGTPLLLSGELSDEAGTASSFRGSARAEILEIERVQGAANLWEIAKGLPAVAPHLPRDWTIDTFPELDVDRIRRDGHGEDTVWTIRNLQIKEPAEITMKAMDREVTARGVTGQAGYDGSRWNVKQLRAKVFGGSVAVEGSFADSRLSKSRVVVDGVRWKELRRWAGHDGNRASRGIVHLDYRGDLNLRNGQARGEGRVRLENAPVIEVPLLDEIYDLFAAMIPGVKPEGEGQFEATFSARPGILEVTRCEAKGGSVTVSAAGTVDLEKKRVDGRARGKLSGLPGLLTSPLGRLLEMDVAGPYDDIQVKPLGPAKLVSNAASTALDAPVEVLEEAGRITGTVVLEGIKLPFRLFSRENKETEGAREKE